MRILSALALFALPFYAFAESIDVGSFNLESGGAELDDLTTQIEAYSGIDVWGYSEVSESWEEDVAISSFLDEGVASTSFLSETGGADRLLIVFNSERFTVLDNGELTNLNIGGNVRGALWVKLKDSLNDDLEFIFMVNHLYRSREGRRHQQATMLNEWARNQTVPIIAVGDYNFDWDIEDGENDHDAGYDNMTKDGVFSWLRPDELIKTQCSPRYNSVLDFIFLSGSAQTWSGTSFIDEVRPDYCSTQGDDESDHRPVFAFIDPSETVEVVPASVDIFSSNSSGDSQSSPNYMLHAVSEDVAWKIDTRTGKLQRCVYVPQGNRVRCTQ